MIIKWNTAVIHHPIKLRRKGQKLTNNGVRDFSRFKLSWQGLPALLVVLLQSLSL